MRYVLAFTVVITLAVPAQARQGEDDRLWLDLKREKIVKILKKVLRTFGDGLTDPRP